MVQGTSRALNRRYVARRSGSEQVNISENLEFAKMFYVSILQAQARDASVSVQMSTVSNGYQKADRIWVLE